jgi:hypothetical protein
MHTNIEHITLISVIVSCWSDGHSCTLWNQWCRCTKLSPVCMQASRPGWQRNHRLSRVSQIGAHGEFSTVSLLMEIIHAVYARWTRVFCLADSCMFQGFGSGSVPNVASLVGYMSAVSCTCMLAWSWLKTLNFVACVMGWLMLPICYINQSWKLAWGAWFGWQDSERQGHFHAIAL